MPAGVQGAGGNGIDETISAAEAPLFNPAAAALQESRVDAVTLSPERALSTLGRPGL